MREKMKLNIIKKVLNVLAKIIHRITVLNVNAACFVAHGQIKEPESLSRYKKHM
jgi:cyclic lactone autoinducer peptide